MKNKDFKKNKMKDNNQEANLNLEMGNEFDLDSKKKNLKNKKNNNKNK